MEKFTNEELSLIREAIESHVETFSNIRDGAGAIHPWHTDPDLSSWLQKFVDLDQKIADFLNEKTKTP